MPLPKNPVNPEGGKLKRELGYRFSSERNLLNFLKIESSSGHENLEFYKRFFLEPPSKSDYQFAQDLDHGFRSKWEANVGRWLKYHGFMYEYEPVKVMFSDGEKYVPDFYVPYSGVWIEVKGIWMTGAKRRVEKFIKTMLPDDKFVVLDEVQYSMLVPVKGWEK